jgi:arylsulfatase A-like enzyme
VDIPSELDLDGVNLLPHFSGEMDEAPHEALYWRFGPQLAIRKGDWKLVKGTPSGQQNSRRGRATLDGAQLFNLADDIGEEHDLAAEHPEKVEELSAAWSEWNSQLADPAWGPPARQRRNANRQGQSQN